MKRVARTAIGVSFAIAFFGIGGCAAMHVKPWDRDLLAEPAMSFQPIPVEEAIDQHIYFSTEGSTGGQEVGGGGCGCN